MRLGRREKTNPTRGIREPNGRPEPEPRQGLVATAKKPGAQ